MKKVFLFGVGVLMCTLLYSQKTSSPTFMSNFYDALSYMYEDNYEVALELWKNAEGKDNNNPNVWYNIGVCYMSTSKDRTKAVDYLTKALEHVSVEYVADDHTERRAPIDCYCKLGIALRLVGKYDESIDMLNTALEVATENNDSAMLVSAKEELVTSNNAKIVSRQKSCNKVIVNNLGDVVNSIYSDHSPIITCDGNKLYFTSKRPNSINDNDYEKIYVTEKNSNGEWSTPELLPSSINTKAKNESVVALSSDGKMLYFFRSGSGLQGNLYVTEMDDKGEWGKPQPMAEIINSKYRETHITMAPDGNSFYFTSDRPGGYGGLDIYTIQKQPDGQWGEPVLLPEEVNSPKDDEYPFVHPNGSVLYFCSKGHESLGGYDVFFSHINGDGTYSQAESMCTPLNTPDNDICYSLSCDGKTAYITGIREDTHGEYDLYEVIEKSNVKDMIAYEGKVYYADGAYPKGVVVWVKDRNTGEDLGSYNVEDATGTYDCYLKVDGEYDLTYSKDGVTLKKVTKKSTDDEADDYASAEKPIKLEDVILPLYNREAEISVYDDAVLTPETIALLDDVINDAKKLNDESRDVVVNLNYDTNKLTPDSPQLQAVVDYLAKNGINTNSITQNQTHTDKNVCNVKVNFNQAIADNPIIGSDTEPVLTDTLEIRNVYFDFDKSDIKHEFRQNLDELAEYMKTYPGVQIEVGGHTDYVGTDEYNMLLSARRAKSVKDYLVGKGVKQDKIVTTKFGESQPIASNNTSASRRYNRRVEFKVLVQGPEIYLKVVDEHIAPSMLPNSGNGTSQASAARFSEDGSIVYRVQIAALKNHRDPSDFGIENLKVKEQGNFYIYYLGTFSTYAEAEKAQAAIKGAFPSAIILKSR